MNKPGYKTTEFWITIMVTLWSMFSGAVPEPYSAVVPVVSGGVYSIARGLAKIGVIRGDAGRYLRSQD